MTAPKSKSKKPGKPAEPPAKAEQPVQKEPKSEQLIIKAKDPRGFYRCGKFWPHEGRTIAVATLSSKELATLKAEPFLQVVQE